MSTTIVCGRHTETDEDDEDNDYGDIDEDRECIFPLVMHLKKLKVKSVMDMFRHQTFDSVRHTHTAAFHTHTRTFAIWANA